MNVIARQPTGWASLLCAALVGGLVGGALVTLLRADTQATPAAWEPSTGHATDERVLAALEELTRVLAAPAQPAPLGQDPSAERASATAPALAAEAADLAALTARLGELTRVLSTLRTQWTSSRIHADTRSFEARPPNAQWHEQVPNLEDEAFSAHHRFWTYQQVLDTYGDPDYVSPRDNRTVAWSYEREYGTEGDDEDLDFVFLEGRVIEAYHSW